MNGSVVEVTGLTARSGSAVLVDDVTFTVPRHGVTALVGPSGSGKTTTALALLGEAEPGVRLCGTVLVDGVAVVGPGGPRAEALSVRGRTLAYMPQHPGSTLNPARRTGRVLAELAALHRAPPPARAARREAVRADARDALRRAQLPPEPALLRRFPHQFSGGQRQRVALAQTLVCGPRVLVLDEPGTGLDALTRRALADELAALAAQGVTLILLSHDTDLVRRLASHVVRLDGGRVADRGPAARLLPRPGTPGAVRGAPPPAPAPPGAPLLEVRGLDAWLRKGRRDPVLHGIGLTVRPGEYLGVTGPSGSGKTTLARVLAGLHERADGRVLLAGTPLPALRHRTTGQKRRVQYVWQEARGSFDEHRTVREQVARTAVRLRGADSATAAEEADALLRRLGVRATAIGRRPASLSGGELQRAALARALLARPDILLCDEITSALDAESAALVVAEVEAARHAHGTGVLWIGHDLAVLRRLTGRVVVLDHGRIAEQGATADVFDHPRSEVARALVEAARPAL
ncbi:ATP-binding cassette domain-containing protein [Streptomyces sp. NPDC047002]|uniref:ABC transporter ATP-binding protein n=1 Tax=Streptomyces sp. NPDC047002 TaxID=3155475 RepID=UPI0034551055